MLRFPPKKILFPVDLSEVSLAAWPLARDLARRFKASLEVLYVEEYLPASEWQFPRRRLDGALRAEILKHVRAKIGPGPRVHIVEGEPAVAILHLARTRRPDLIVMGTHGRTGLARAWMGSVAEAVVRLSPVPVLTTRGTPKAIRSVLAPVNFASYADYGFVFAAGVAAALKARLTALHVAADERAHPNPKFALSNLIMKLPRTARHASAPRAEALKGDPTRRILEAAKKHDLLVLVAHQRWLLEDLVLGMTAERVLRHSPIPVLSVPSPKNPFSAQKWVRSETAAAAAR